jgi:plastocyanin
MIEPPALRASRIRRVAGKAGLALLMAAAVGFARAVPASETHTIAMDGTRFVPETLTIKQGDRVVWVNKDPFPHTATAAGVFDSKSMAPGQSWSYVPNRSGELPYVCTLHPGMRGTLIVH